MFQESALFPWLDAFGNVMFGLKLKPDLTERERREIADHYLRLVGLEKFRHAHVHELSGGMKQRVALARSLAPDPQVLLMDEPFAALDALTRDQLYDDIQRIWMESRKTIVFVTHNVREAVCLGDRVVLMVAAPGRIDRIFDIRCRVRATSTARNWRATPRRSPRRSRASSEGRPRNEARGRRPPVLRRARRCSGSLPCAAAAGRRSSFPRP